MFDFMHESWARVLGAVALLLFGLTLRMTLVAIVSRAQSLKDLLPRWLSLQKKFAGSLDFLIFAILFHVTAPLFSFSDANERAVEHIATVVLTLSSTWFLVQLADFLQKIIQARLTTKDTDDLRQRRMRTQVQFIFRMTVVTLLVVGFAATLMSFDGARRIGASLIASAGVASVVVGFAAQKSLANLIAGFQIAFTQPIRIDDVVVVEGEWGIIEEISLTYVVVRVWDLRRLILPITYFIEKPFQNWTRTSSNIMGYFFLYTDYNVPVAALRKALTKQVAASPLWDGQTCVLQVTNISERAVELRALVSARSAGDAFDLRCILREQMLALISESYPSSLPLQRGNVKLDREEAVGMPG